VRGEFTYVFLWIMPKRTNSAPSSPGDHLEDALLLTPLELGLESHDRKMTGRQVVLAQLDDGMRTPPVARVAQADRLHRPEAQGVAAAARDHLHRQAALEEELVFERMHGGALGRRERAIEGRVLRLVQRAIDVVVAAFPVTRGAKGLPEVDGVGVDHRADRVVEVELFRSDERCDVARQRLGGERPGGDDRDWVVGNAGDLLPEDAHVRQCLRRTP
jgi:hypothetical protein